MNEQSSFSLRINKDLWEKFKYIANYEFRSSNRQLVHIIKTHIVEFEKEHGKIDVKK